MPLASPSPPKIYIGLVENEPRNLTVIRSSTTFNVRPRPYLVLPAVLGLWLTGISAILAPLQLARAGMKRCISPYSFVSSRTSLRYTFSVQP